MSIAKNIINQNTATLELLKGKNSDGTAFYSYVLFPADVFEIVKEKFGKEEIDISKYGIVLHTGAGSEPEEGVEEKVFEYFKSLQK